LGLSKAVDQYDESRDSIADLAQTSGPMIVFTTFSLGLSKWGMNRPNSAKTDGFKCLIETLAAEDPYNGTK
jgi:hypothetical protein